MQNFWEKHRDEWCKPGVRVDRVADNARPVAGGQLRGVWGDGGVLCAGGILRWGRNWRVEVNDRQRLAMWRKLAKQASRATLTGWDAQQTLDALGHDAVASGLDWLWHPMGDDRDREQARRNLQTLAQREIARLK